MDVAHSLLMKLNEGTCAMGTLKSIRKQKMNEQGGHCFYCALPMWDKATEKNIARQLLRKVAPKALQCTAEHLHPRSEGGKDTAVNIVAACWFCNTQRHRRKLPRSPEVHRQYVQRQMAAGRWLAKQFASLQ